MDHVGTHRRPHLPRAGQAPQKRYYAISAGRKTGIFTDVQQYLAATEGYRAPRGRKFTTYEDAWYWLQTELAARKTKAAAQRRKRVASQKEKARKQIQHESPRIKKIIGAMDARHVLALDIELTGLTADAEILQVSIVNGLGMVLCNQYFKPEHVTTWDETVPIHHITPGRVADEPYFRTYTDHLSQIFSQAQAIVGYSTMQDIATLHKHGVAMPHKSIYIDTGEAYSYVQAALTTHRMYAKLQDCASHYGYGIDQWHDSLADTKATLFCFYALLNDEKALFRFHTFGPSKPAAQPIHA